MSTQPDGTPQAPAEAPDKGVGCDALLASFIFDHRCRDWCDTYVAALKILGEQAKDGWTYLDVIEAVKRALANVRR